MVLNTESSDEELICMLNNGSEEAFELIYRRYWKRCYQAAFKVLHDDNACLDIVQEVFIWIWENRLKVQAVSLGGYLSTAVKFKMLNLIRQKNTYDKNVQAYSYSSTPLATHEEHIEYEQLKQMVDAFVAELPKQAKIIFQLSRDEALSHRKIAQHLNLSEKTVKNQINLTLKKLRAFVGRVSYLFLFL